jgi:hypothetical protein
MVNSYVTKSGNTINVQDMVIFVFDSAARVFGSLLVIVTIVKLGMLVKLLYMQIRYINPKTFIKSSHYYNTCLPVYILLYICTICNCAHFSYFPN